MQIPLEWHNYVPTLLGFLVYTYLIYCGIRWQMLAEFRVFYLYVAVSSLTSLTNWTVLSLEGYSSWAYTYAYFGGQAAKCFCELAILGVIFLRIYRPRSVGRYLPGGMALGAAAAMVAAIGRTSIWMLPLIAPAVQLVLLALIWGRGLARRRIASLGLNWCGILIGLTLGALLKLGHLALNPFFEEAYAEAWRVLIQPIEFAPWVVFALTMGSRDTSRISRRRRLRRRADTAAADRSTSAAGQLPAGMVRRVR